MWAVVCIGAECEGTVRKRVKKKMPFFKVAPGAVSHRCSTSPTFALSPSHMSHLQTALPEAPASLTAVASAAQETNCPPSWCQRTQEISQVASCEAAAAAPGTGRAPPPATAAGLGLAAASSRSPSPDKAQLRQAGKAELRSTQDGAEQKNAALFSQGKL